VEEQQECSRITERRRTSLQQRFKEAVVDSDNLIQKNLIHTIACRRKEEDTTATTPSDYGIAVDIAGGNKRVAVRYMPLMLIGSAQTWLNSLPALQINSWYDFKEAFFKNFTRTYKRPPRPRQLALCKQGPDELDRDYLGAAQLMRGSR
jgi:hypothetical protein